MPSIAIHRLELKPQHWDMADCHLSGGTLKIFCLTLTQWGIIGAKADWPTHSLHWSDDQVYHNLLILGCLIEKWKYLSIKCKRYCLEDKIVDYMASFTIYLDLMKTFVTDPFIVSHNLIQIIWIRLILWNAFTISCKFRRLYNYIAICREQ